ncbi:hypothetical protein CRM22_000040 [Opisthorchis felineus]|uniref:Ethanolaminephosphotransferase 1 n=1 Tax=Opisthorchis felineus TaxID=147828 RepID=A0A4S2MNY3_OPIFE|nr:hypothetical protein CRM22_000040 [Opisthorchis felineus]
MLTENMKANLISYKYSCRDTSPLSNAIMHPFWDWVTKFYPKWLAPNLLTFAGFLLTVLHFLILTYFNPQFDNPGSVPGWAWLLTALLVFLAHTMDGTDGKQARRTGSSSPLGELFDHGCDSWSMFFIPAALLTMCGSYSTPIRLFFLQWILLWTFLSSHWEKYITGVLFLPWAFDFAQLGVILSCILAYKFGFEIFGVPIVFGLSMAVLFEITLLVSFFLVHIPFTMYNLLHDCTPGVSWHRGRGYMEAFRPTIPMATLMIMSTIWVFLSPSDIMSRQPRLFLYGLCTVGSNVCCHLIMAQLCKIRAPFLNWLVVVYSCFALTLCAFRFNGWALSLELPALALLCLVVTIEHVHYAYKVVSEISVALNIPVFRLKTGE